MFFVVLVAVGARVCVGYGHVEDTILLESPEAVASGISTISICGLFGGRLFLCRSIGWRLLLLLLLLLRRWMLHGIGVGHSGLLNGVEMGLGFVVA